MVSQYPAAKQFKEKVLNYEIYSVGPVKITPVNIIKAAVITQAARDVYIMNK